MDVQFGYKNKSNLAYCGIIFVYSLIDGAVSFKSDILI